MNLYFSSTDFCKEETVLDFSSTTITVMSWPAIQRIEFDYLVECEDDNMVLKKDVTEHHPRANGISAARRYLLRKGIFA